MILEALIVGLFLGKIRKGNINQLNNVVFNGQSLFIGFVIFDFLIRFYIVKSKSDFSFKLFDIYPIISLVIYFLIISLLEVNKDKKFLRIVQSGFVLNFIPMILNSGKMPVSPDALRNLGMESKYNLLASNSVLTHQLANENTRFYILSDIIPVRIFLDKIISFGDILIFIGIVGFLATYMVNQNRNN